MLAVAGDNIVSSQNTEWGLGAVQEIDAAAMSVWLQCDHFHGSVELRSGGCGSTSNGWHCDVVNPGIIDLRDIKVVKGGALINF